MTVIALPPRRVGVAPLWRLLPLGFVWAAGIEMLLLTVGYGRQHGFGGDAHAYWFAAQHLSYARPPRSADAFLYSPLFADLLKPFGFLPWPVFYGAWIAGSGAVLCWLVRPLPTRWAVPVVLFCSFELLLGNVHLLLAAVIVAGVHGSRAAWLFPILTKVATGVGLIWFAARGDWRHVGQSAGLLLLVVGGSYLAQPEAWNSWVGMLLQNRADTPDGPAGFAVRAVAAVVVLVVAARTRSAWGVAVATMLVNPVSVLGGLALLAAIPQLVMSSSPKMPRPTV